MNAVATFLLEFLIRMTNRRLRGRNRLPSNRLRFEVESPSRFADATSDGM